MPYLRSTSWLSMQIDKYICLLNFPHSKAVQKQIITPLCNEGKRWNATLCNPYLFLLPSLIIASPSPLTWWCSQWPNLPRGNLQRGFLENIPLVHKREGKRCEQKAFSSLSVLHIFRWGCDVWSCGSQLGLWSDNCEDDCLCNKTKRQIRNKNHLAPWWNSEHQ